MAAGKKKAVAAKRVATEGGVRSTVVAGKAKAAEKVAVAAPAGVAAVAPKKAEKKNGKKGGKKGKKEEATEEAVEGEEEATEKKGKKGGKKAKVSSVEPYPALKLSSLPEAFQEREIEQFIAQFDPKVIGCYVVRTSSHRSRGIAYVRFAEGTEKDALNGVFEEFHGMLLGGNTVTAKWVKMTRPFPKRAEITLRRKSDFARRTRGAKMTRHNRSQRLEPSKKEWVGVLMRAAKTERKTNTALEKLGITYAFNGFQKQLDALSDDDRKAWHASYRDAKVAQKERRATNKSNKGKKAEPKKANKVVSVMDAPAKKDAAKTAAKAVEKKEVKSAPAKAKAAKKEDKPAPVAATKKAAEKKPAEKKPAAKKTAPKKAAPAKKKK